MTKWICNECVTDPCQITIHGDGIPEGGPCADTAWRRVKEPPINDPPFKRDDSLDAYKFVVSHIDEEKIEDVAGLLKTLEKRYHPHEANIQEMAGNLKALKERVEALEKEREAVNKEVWKMHIRAVEEERWRVNPAWTIIGGQRGGKSLYNDVCETNTRIERLEYQMKHHYHHTGVWCETDDGCGTKRLVK